MDMEEYLKYKENENFEFSIYDNSFVTFLGEGNRKLLEVFMFNKKSDNIRIMNKEIKDMSLYKIKRHITYVINKDLDTFVAETVEDEIAFGLESLAKPKNEMKEIIYKKSREFHLTDLLKRSPESLGSSDKTKLKILSALIFEPHLLVLGNVLSELDYDDKLRVISLLKEYVNNGNIVLNFTNDVEETLYGDRVIITGNDELIAEGSTKSILNEERLMKKLGFGLPFIIELNKLLMDYEIIKKYELDMEKLVDKIWK